MKLHKSGYIVLLASLWVLPPRSASAFYNPATGRWLNRDPIAESGGLAINAAARNNLVCHWDSLGLYWTRDIWSGGWGAYTGNAYAWCTGDTLEDLADLITGNRADTALLSAPRPIAPQQKVDITPLLMVLEDRLRKNVVNATRMDFNPGFGVVNIPAFFDSGSDGVDAFFDEPGILATVDCKYAAAIMLAKGLLETIGGADFDGLHYTYWNWPRKLLPEPSVGKLRFGDVAYIKNYDDYVPGPNSPWAGENVIKVGDDDYWGFGASSRSMQGWEQLLQDAYNSENGTDRTDKIPGLQNALFIDVAKMAEKRFELRRGRH